MQAPDLPTLQVKARTMYGTLYEGPAKSVSAANSLGPFDVLPGHANMLAILSDCSVVIAIDKERKEFAVTRGILRVTNNIIDLFINAQ